MEIPAFQRNAVVLFRSRGDGVRTPVCLSPRGECGRCWACPKEEVGYSEYSCGRLCRGELADFLLAGGKS